MIHTITAKYGNLLLRQPEPRDLELLRGWRNVAENSRYIRDVGWITEEMQAAWFEGYLADDDHALFVFEETSDLNRAVGSVSLYNFRPAVCECGKFLVGDPDARGRGIGRLGIAMAMYVGFEVFKVDAVDAVVHEDNVAALTTDQKAGFEIVGEHPNPLAPGKMEKELLSRRSHFYGMHDFLSQVVIEGTARP